MVSSPVKYAQWPQSPKPPRKERTPISPKHLDQMIAGLRENNFGETADLSVLLHAFGGRVGVEALRPGGCHYRTQEDGLLVVFIVGKGGNERLVPVVCKEAKAIITDRKRFNAVVAIPYKTHLWRWNRVAELNGIKGLATFHHIRHKYATDRLKASGGNLRLVQELLGHSNPATTAIYAHVSMDDKVRALTTE
jgi:site-specific recombinase XerC